MKSTNIHLGAAYYPEHWSEDRWAEDIRLMQAAGFTVVRMAEFAWSRFEPQEGKFEFDWLERAIAQLAEAGIAAVLGTPTAAPPAWMVQRYPEILRTDADGRKTQFGNRCHYCVNNLKYHQLTARMVEAMGKRFGANPHVIGWQLDNEFGAECHCEHCRAEFQAFLKAKFRTLDELNERWTTAYWSQEYTDWAQIELPRGGHNPGLMLAYRQYLTEAYRRYQALQIESLRKFIPAAQWITHNYMSWFGSFDHYKLAKELDIVSEDYYVGSGHSDPARSGAVWDLMRGLKHQHFWLMETQPGGVNWSTTNTKLNKGETRALAWQAIGHGADAVLYWQWRSALNGQEQYHGTLVDQAGLPRPFYEEAADLGDDLARTRAVLAGTTVQAPSVAILNDYESRWSLEHQRHHKDFDYTAQINRWYRPLAQNNISVDILSADASITSYQLVIAPHLAVMDAVRAQKLHDFVQHGGVLVLTCRSGMKDHCDAMLPTRPPGAILRELAGVEVEEYYPLDRSVAVSSSLFRGSAETWAEKLHMLAEDETASPAQIIAQYEDFNGWIDDSPAVTARTVKRGMVYYVGCVLDDVSMKKFIDHILQSRQITPAIKNLPPGVEVCTRVSEDGKAFHILINHNNQTKKVHFPPGLYEFVTQTAYEGDVNMPPYAVAVLGVNEQREIV